MRYSKAFWFYRATLLLCAIPLTGCLNSPVLVDLPHHHHSSPETTGKGNLSFGYRLNSKTQAILSSDYTSVPVNTSNPNLHQTLSSSLNSHVGFTDNIDGFLGLVFQNEENNQSQSTGKVQIQPAIGLKYQFLGEPRSTAKPGNISSAIELIVGTTQDNYKHKSTNNSYAASNSYNIIQIITGYRNLADNVFYGKIFNGIHQISGSVTLSSSNTPFSGKISELGYGIGILFSSDKILQSFEMDIGLEFTQHNFQFLSGATTDQQGSFSIILHF